MTDLKSAQQFDNAAFVRLQNASEPELKRAQQLQDSGFVADLPAVNALQAKQNHSAGFSTGFIWLSVGLTLVLLLAVMQWADFVQQSLSQSLLQGSAAIALTVVGAGAVLKLFWSSWRGKRQRHKRQRWREQAQAIAENLQYGQARPLCQQILSSLPKTEGQLNFSTQHQIEHSDAETLQLFDLLVLQPIDAEASARISAAAKQVGVAVAISPFALADMLLIGWRGFRLMAELSDLYGVRLGTMQRMALLKKFAEMLFWTGATELAIDVGGDFLGAELSSKLSARAGQGMLAGLMLARLGRFVQQQLRPLPMVGTKSQVQPLLQSLLQRLLQKPPAQ